MQGSSGREARLLLPLALYLMQPPDADVSVGGDGGAPERHRRRTAGAAAAQAAFSRGWRRVPLRALLPWLSQMLSRLGAPEGAALVAPLEELARR